MKEIQRLMGCIVYAGKPAEETPYADLLSPCQWQQVAMDFTRQACNLMGQVSLEVGTINQSRICQWTKSHQPDARGCVSPECGTGESARKHYNHFGA